MTVEHTSDTVHFLDPERHWALCGALPEGPSWSGAPERVTCPWCLRRLNRMRASLQQRQQPAELVGSGPVEQVDGARAADGDPALPPRSDPAAGEG